MNMNKKFKILEYADSFDFCTIEEKRQLYYMLLEAFRWGQRV
jgi:hypothetical protein